MEGFLPIISVILHFTWIIYYTKTLSVRESIFFLWDPTPKSVLYTCENDDIFGWALN